MIDVLGTILRLRDAKRAANVIPDDVLITDLTTDIIQQVRAELNHLYVDKKISVKRTLNNQSIEIL